MTGETIEGMIGGMIEGMIEEDIDLQEETDFLKVLMKEIKINLEEEIELIQRILIRTEIIIDKALERIEEEMIMNKIVEKIENMIILKNKVNKSKVDQDLTAETKIKNMIKIYRNQDHYLKKIMISISNEILYLLNPFILHHLIIKSLFLINNKFII